MTRDIDFLLTYLNPNDVAWQAEKNRFSAGETSDVNPNRYREWDNLRYLFRSVERFAPWIRTFHVVTCGHLPDWLDASHPKIHVVRHADYLPAEWLPTFSSRCIDMNFHRIPDLAEHFVYFNDDMFLGRPVSPTDFFSPDGLPLATAILVPTQLRAVPGQALHLAPVVNTAVVNAHFAMKRVIRQRPFNWLSPKYGRALFRSALLMSYDKFPGFRPVHLPYSYLKSTYATVWDEESGRCASASAHRFREIADLNHWIFDFWQFASNRFRPRSLSAGRCFQLRTPRDAVAAAAAIRARRFKLLCLNDVVEDPADFPGIAATVNNALAGLFPEKSSFEK